MENLKRHIICRKKGLRTRWIAAGIFLPLFMASCTFLNHDRGLSIDHPGDVSFMGIYGRDTVEISRQPGGWVMNESQRPDSIAVANFLYAMSNLEITGASVAGNVDSLVSRKIIVRQDRKHRIYRFYEGPGYSLMHYEGSAKVYSIRLKASPDASLGKVFSDLPADWADRLIINLSPDELLEMEVVPAALYGNGFRMVKDSNNFNVYDLSGKRVETVNPEKTLLYSSYFRDIYYDSEIHEDSIINRISVAEPFYSFRVKTLKNKELTFSVFPLYGDNGEVDIYFGALLHAERDFPLRVNYAYLDAMFQDLQYFAVE